MDYFGSLEEVEAFIFKESHAIHCLREEAEAIKGAVSSEVWLNGNCPSYVVAIDDEDQEIACFRIGEVGVQSVAK